MLHRASDFLGIEWAPRNIPMARRLETLAAAAWMVYVLFGEGISIILYINLLYSSIWWLTIAYGIWMLYDIDIPNRGGRKIDWVRNWAWWRYYRNYFPINLVKTVDLDPSNNYLFACFPHGLVCSGVCGAFATNALNFYKTFPKMTCHMITLAGHFSVPFFRDLLLALGMCSSSSESLMYLLDKKRFQGKCVALIVGGAAEALDSHPGQYKIVLKKRKGFIKIAMKTGTPLVPVFSFGEPDIFKSLNNPQGSLLRKVQEKILRVVGISPMFPIGRGMFQYSYGVVPLRSPITTVVGEPLEVETNLDPDEAEVDALHAEFTNRLIQLFEREKVNYLNDYENVQLVIT